MPRDDVRSRDADRWGRAPKTSDSNRCATSDRSSGHWSHRRQPCQTRRPGLPADHMPINLIGVPFDGVGRPRGQAGAPSALRDAGLQRVLRSRSLVSEPDLRLPASSPTRGATTGLLNERELLAMIPALNTRLCCGLSGPVFVLAVLVAAAVEARRLGPGSACHLGHSAGGGCRPLLVAWRTVGRRPSASDADARA